MINLDWFEQFSNFNSFHFIIKYFDDDIDGFDDLICCCSFLSYSFVDAFTFISDFVNVNYLVVDFDFTIKNNNLNIYIIVDSVDT